MKIDKNNLIAVLLVLNIAGCVQTINSSSTDKELYSVTTIDESTPAGQRFSAAFKVIKNNCVSCHSTMNLTSDAAWIDSGYIVVGNAASSPLFGRIKGSSSGAEDMPKDATISSEDVNTIRVWINSLN